jgi:hypothetical protein
MKKCIVNVAVGGWYPKGQDRLKETLLNNGYDGDFLFWKDEYPANSPTHQAIPYAFKSYAMLEAAQKYDLVLWADASFWNHKNPNNVFEIINDKGSIFIEDSWLAGQWCSDKAVEALQTTREELFTLHFLLGGFFGLKTNEEKSKEFLKLFFEMTNNKDIMVGDWINKNNSVSSDSRVLGHRHDQPVITLLNKRIGMNTQKVGNIFEFGPKTTEKTEWISQGM